MRTEFSCESLRDDELETGCYEERVDTEIRQTLKGIDRRVCMDSREHEVTGDRSLDSKTCRFRVTYLSDHDDIGILTQETSKAIRKIESDLWIYLRMVYSLDPILDRILESRDIFLFWVETREHRIEGRRLSGTGRSDYEDQSELIFEMLFDLDHIHREHSYSSQIHELAFFPQESDYDLFPINSRNNTHS